MKKSIIAIIILVCISIIGVLLLSGCATTVKANDVIKDFGKTSSISISTNLLSSQVLIYSDQQEIDEIFGWFDGINLTLDNSFETENPASTDYSYINVNAASVDGENTLRLCIDKDGRVIYQSNSNVYVSAVGAFDRDAFVQQYGVVTLR